MKIDFPNLKRYASENLKLHESANNGNLIIFFGDSITEFWTKRNSDIFKKSNYINRGISGQTTPQMVLRFQQDVIDLKPATVIILCGINDIAENTGPISVGAIFQNIVVMAEHAIINKIKVMLCSVLPSNSITWKTDIAPSDKIIQLNQMLSGYAENNKIIYADYYSVMANKSKGLDFQYSDDGVHPNTAGYKVMEGIITSILS